MLDEGSSRGWDQDNGVQHGEKRIAC